MKGLICCARARETTARSAHGLSASGTGGGLPRTRTADQPLHCEVPQPALGPAVRAGARDERTGGPPGHRVVRIRVPLHEQRDGSYDIAIGPGLLAELPALLQQHCPAPAYAVVTDSHVAKLYGDEVVKRVASTGPRAELFTFPAGEWNKTRETWASLSDRMLASHFGRDCARI